MATLNLTAEEPLNLLDTLAEDDIVRIVRSDEPATNYLAIGFETSDALDLREFPGLTAAQMLEAAIPIIGGVRFQTPLFTLTLAGITRGQLSEDNFIFASPPEAVPDSTTIAEGGTAVIPVLANDSDADGDSFSITGVTSPANGTVEISDDTLVYNPTESTFSGVDSFIYTITDSRGETGTASVTVTVGGNQPPDAVADTVEAIAGIANSIDVLANDTDPDGDTLSIASVSDGANGTVRIVDSQVVYTPNEATFAGTDSFSYTITDNNGGTDQATVNVTVGENQHPIAAPDMTTIPVEGTASISVLENDSDPNGDRLSIVGISDPLNGSAEISGDQVIYTPGRNPAGSAFAGVDTFFYTIDDGNEGVVSSRVTVTVGGPQPPVAADDSAVTTSATDVTIDVLANDTDPDGDSLSIPSIGTETPNGGTLSLSGNEIVYTPEATFSGTDSFTYSITDSQGGNNSATVSVTVIANQGPTAANDNETIPITGTSTINVLSNDSDPNITRGDRLSVTGAGGNSPSLGALSVVNGNAIYTPNQNLGENFTGTDRFTYTIQDATGATSTAMVTLNLGGPQPPRAENDTTMTLRGFAVTIPVLVNDRDMDGGTLSITSVSDPANGSASINNNGTANTTDDRIVYTPDSTFVGTEIFTYSITDGQGSSDSAHVVVTVSENLPPVAVNDTETIPLRGSSTVDVLDNDSDPNASDGFSITGVSGNAISPFGSVTVTDGEAIYTPNPNLGPSFIGTDSFTYTIQDSVGVADSATVTLTIGGNQPPDADNDTTTAVVAIPVTIDVLNNDSDPDSSPNGGTLSITGVGGAANGTVTIHDNGTPTISDDDVVIYTTTNTTFTGTDSFVYSVTDGDGTSGATVSATVHVTVVANDGPTPMPDTATALPTGSSTIDVLSNDTDANMGDILSVTGVGSQTNDDAGNVALTDGQVIYTSSGSTENFTATDSFTYTVSDLSGNTATSTVSVTVGGPQPPIAEADSVTIVNRTTTLSALTDNDRDPEDDTFSIVGVGTPANGGTATVDSGQVIYTAGTDTFMGTDTFTYSIADGTGTDSATVMVKIEPSQAPEPENDTTTIQEGGTATVMVLENDKDPDSPTDILQLVGLSKPINGDAEQNGNNVMYVPNPDFVGVDRFTYSVTDGFGGTASATVDVRVGGNQPPVADNVMATAIEAIPVMIDVLQNVSDPDSSNDTFSMTGVGGATNGTVAISDDMVLYTPASTFTGNDSFTYTIQDDRGSMDSATVNVTVLDNNAPTAAPDSTSLVATTTINVLDNDNDPNTGDTLSVTGVGSQTNAMAAGTVSLRSGNVIYSPHESAATGATATNDRFTYTISDLAGNTATSTVTVTVGGPQPPMANDDYAIAIMSQMITIPVLLNDSDPNGDTLSITGVSSPTNGNAVINDDQIIYTANATAGTETFTYTIGDGNEGMDTAMVTVRVFADDANTPREITGNDYPNVIVGSNGTATKDELNGGSGNDTLIGGGGPDELTGGAGADEFHFLADSDSTMSEQDFILDFTEEDTIRLAFQDNSTGVSVTRSGGSALFNLTIADMSFNLNILTDPEITDEDEIMRAIQFGS
ncbi:MAG: tandem-95 repeat protein [Hormoscilla sp. GUM202]|nr:tandem-95 repeat protein [Hormoscilla sp. GUM202]